MHFPSPQVSVVSADVVSRLVFCFPCRVPCRVLASRVGWARDSDAGAAVAILDGACIYRLLDHPLAWSMGDK